MNTFCCAGLNCHGDEDDHAIPEISLRDMGFDEEKAVGLNIGFYKPKDDLYDVLHDMIHNRVHTDIVVQIGNETVNCHKMVLQIYSALFEDVKSEAVVQLDEKAITKDDFVLVYKWMLEDNPTIQYDNVLKLYNAATVLRIDDLVTQCLNYLDNGEVFCESIAFLVSMEARKYNMPLIQQAMLGRVCKFFLTLVATTDFLQLKAVELCALLNSNALGVNSEIEVFMSALRWLNYNWEERKEHVIPVMGCVRFGLMPSWYLALLIKTPDVFIKRNIIDSEVQEAIAKGITYNTALLHFNEDDKRFEDFLGKHNISKEFQRKWIYDWACHHHHYRMCPSKDLISYNNFTQYLEMLVTFQKDYWRSFELTPTTTSDDGQYPCCKRGIFPFRAHRD